MAIAAYQDPESEPDAARMNYYRLTGPKCPVEALGGWIRRRPPLLPDLLFGQRGGWPAPATSFKNTMPMAYNPYDASHVSRKCVFLSSMRGLPFLNALRVFEAATLHQGFTREADELCVTASGQTYLRAFIPMFDEPQSTTERVRD